jgi:NAD(P)-dependent dehydrogenase (short-subunit alcohol dehydrogenase family)
VKERIVVTASLAHKGGRIDFSDLAAERGYFRWPRYQMSKLANMLHFAELDRRLKASGRETFAVGCHPGGAITELSRHLPAPMQWLMPLSRPFFNTAAQGAWPTLQAATWPEAKGGDYFGPQGIAEMQGRSGKASSTRTARDPALAAELWARSIDLTGVDPGL